MLGATMRVGGPVVTGVAEGRGVGVNVGDAVSVGVHVEAGDGVDVGDGNGLARTGVCDAIRVGLVVADNVGNGVGVEVGDRAGVAVGVRYSTKRLAGVPTSCRTGSGLSLIPAIGPGSSNKAASPVASTALATSNNAPATISPVLSHCTHGSCFPAGDADPWPFMARHSTSRARWCQSIRYMRLNSPRTSETMCGIIVT